MEKKISLIGFMGSGKSTVGQALAKKLGFSFIDLDSFIEQIANQSIKEIFATQGEQAFRKLEHEALMKASESKGACVLATGGGVVTNEVNRALLKENWFNIYLHARPDTILSRLEADNTERPLLQTEDKFDRIQRLMQDRLSWYADVRHQEIAVDEKSINAIVDSIFRML